MPLEINNNETYADMTNHLPRIGKVGMNVIPVGIYRYFGSSNKEKVAKLSTVKHKASINAI